jgi:hypothetical protein
MNRKLALSIGIVVLGIAGILIYTFISQSSLQTMPVENSQACRETLQATCSIESGTAELPSSCTALDDDRLEEFEDVEGVSEIRPGQEEFSCN